MNDRRHRFAWLRRRGGEAAEVEPGMHENREPRPVGLLVRMGERVCLRAHVPENRADFQAWYADDEIARLLRHDQRPLNSIQSKGYFDTIIMPMSARGQAYAIHENSSGRLIGTTALTDFQGPPQRRTGFFRIVIGDKSCWGRGYGTEATALVMAEAFERHSLATVKLEVFRHNERAARAYLRVGFEQTGEHVEWVGRERWELFVLEMELTRERFEAATGLPKITPVEPPPGD